MHELKLMDVQKKYKDKEAVRKFNYTFTNEIWYIVLGINICFAIGCLVKGLVSYKTKQFA
jgi:hypothetical protein